MTNFRSQKTFALFLGTFLAVLNSFGQGVEIYRSEASGAGGSGTLPLPVRISFSETFGYDENANTSSFSEDGSFYSTSTINLNYLFGTERTQANLAGSAGFSYYPDRDGDEFDPNVFFQLSVTHGVSERMLVSANLLAKYEIEPDFTILGSQNRRSGNYLYSLLGLSASYQWLERFSTVTGYSVAVFRYDEDIFATFQDRFENTFSQQFRFLLLPVTTLVTDYRFSFVRYETVNRDSETHSLLFGLDQTLGPRLQGTFRAGVDFRSSETGSGDGVNPYVDGSLNFVVGDKTSLSLNVHYATEEANLVEASSRDSFNAGLNVRYGLTPRISSNLSCYYRSDQYDGQQSLFDTPSFSEDSLDVGVDLQYALNERISASAGYHHTEIISDTSARSYSRARYFGGLNFSF